MTYTHNSRIGHVLNHPVGNDLLYKIFMQADMDNTLLNNPIVRSLKLKTVKRLSKGMLTDGFIDTICRLLNDHPERIEKETPRYRDKNASGDLLSTDERTSVWWQEAVFYQVYPRSFMDSNGDGIGDIRGIISKLEYLKSLGIDALWLSPVYDSPMADMGYDIRDYRKILADYGTMEDFDELLAKAHKLGIRLLMDLVLNHTSDEHEWFVDAVNNPLSPYRDYYIRRKGKPGVTPNNWTSFFSESAWRYEKKTEEWFLHLFAHKQVDLNWDNPVLRREMSDIARFWLDKGVDGFRLDVVNYISKAEGLPKSDPSILRLMGYSGIESYFFGPRLHDYLRELHDTAFYGRDIFTIGETPGCGLEMTRLLTHPSRSELDACISFDHLENPGKARFDIYCYELAKMKNHFIKYQNAANSGFFPVLYFENHDNPRIISKMLGNDLTLRDVAAKLIAVLMLTQRGVPFIYQGQELGMVNCDFESIDEFHDIESLNLSLNLTERFTSDAVIINTLRAGSRDNARTPVQWDDSKSFGFTSGIPWLRCNRDGYTAKDQENDSNSILNFYRKLIALRKTYKALSRGEFVGVRTDVNTYCYFRNGTERLYIETNLTNRKVNRKKIPKRFVLLLTSYTVEPSNVLRPYEANIYVESK